MSYLYQNGALIPIENGPLDYDWQEWSQAVEKAGYELRTALGILDRDEAELYERSVKNETNGQFEYFWDLTIGSYCHIIYCQTLNEALLCLSTHLAALLSLNLQSIERAEKEERKTAEIEAKIKKKGSNRK